MRGRQQTRIGEVLIRTDEWIDIVPDQKYKQVTVRLWGKGVTLRIEADGSQIAASRQRAIRSGQFILSRIDARNGAFGLVPDDLDGAVVSNDFPSFEVNRRQLLPSFLGWMSKTRDFVRLCEAASEGTTNRVRLQEERFLAMEITLPPLTEQHRIVARIDALASRIEEAKGLRKQAIEEVEAVSHSSSARINEHLTMRYGVRRLESLIIGAGYGTSAKCSYDREQYAYPVLRIPNILSEQVDLSDLKYGRLGDKESGRVALNEGDILVVRTNGSAELVGRSAVVSTIPEPMAFASYLIRIQCDTRVVLPNYLQRILRHLRTSGKLFDFARTTAGQYNVSLGRLRLAIVPLPPIDEQRRIVAYLDDLQARVDAVKRLQSETQAELEALLPSVLDRAFRGDL